MHLYNVNVMLLLAFKLLCALFVGMCGIFAALLKKQRRDFERRWKRRERDLTHKKF